MVDGMFLFLWATIWKTLSPCLLAFSLRRLVTWQLALIVRAEWADSSPSPKSLPSPTTFTLSAFRSEMVSPACSQKEAAIKGIGL